MQRIMDMHYCLKVLKSGNITNGMKWRVERTSSGALKITARTGITNGRVLALEDLDTGNDNGDILQQRVYADDNYYKDEWELMKVGEDVFLLGVRDNSRGHYHTSSHVDSMKIMKENGINSFDILSTNSITVDDCIEFMEKSRIFVTNSHGGSDEVGTSIQLFDSTGEILRSQDIYDFDAQHRNCDLSNVEIAIFVGCQTANHENRSLLHAAVLAGATWAIGFEESIDCTQADIWTEYFWKYYYEKGDVKDAAEKAAEMAMLIYPVRHNNIMEEGLLDNSIKSVRVISRDEILRGDQQ